MNIQGHPDLIKKIPMGAHINEYPTTLSIKLDLESWASCQKRTKQNTDVLFSFFSEKIWYHQMINDERKVQEYKSELTTILHMGNLWNVKSLSGGKHPALKGLMVLGNQAQWVILKRHKIDRGTNSYSEVGAYKIDQAFGFNMVPMTIIRKFNNKTYSVQAYIKGPHVIPGKELSYSEKKKSLPPKAQLFDFMIAQWDRGPKQNFNPGNYLITWMKDPILSINDAIVMKTHYILIDHSMALRSSDIQHSTFLYKKDVWYLNKKTLKVFLDASNENILEKYKQITREDLELIDSYFLVKPKRACRFLRRRNVFMQHVNNFESANASICMH